MTQGTTMTDLTTFRNQGRDAALSGAVRVAPIAALLAQDTGIGPLDAWYEGFDSAKGFGPYINGADACHAAYVPKGLTA